MTGLDHSHSEAIETAAQWLSKTSRDRVKEPIIPLLRKRYGITVAEACEVCRQANLRRGEAA
ncbi:hypothetical protein [Mesorhizobium sp.]|uniref:hypothetical protein n=1 Tax=Mesorhizobium sp. TaxID=1871066 RepID=UPI000FE888ED|nr:hypothetical protein [Mesorhizobium sp.]RWN59619.1 MAG: hypothetical protein EOS00_19305 [Mesorhizobium sp.]